MSFLFCLHTLFIFGGRFFFLSFFEVWRNFDVDCVCETMIIRANKKKKDHKSTSDDSFCTVIVTQVDLKTVKMWCFSAECKETSVCGVRQQTKSCCITNKPIFCMTCLINCDWVFVVDPSWFHIYTQAMNAWSDGEDLAVTNFYQKRAFFSNSLCFMCA